MAEIRTDLIALGGGQSFTADDDGALIITGAHTHADILRYVASDIGAGDAIHILQEIESAS